VRTLVDTVGGNSRKVKEKKRADRVAGSGGASGGSHGLNQNLMQKREASTPTSRPTVCAKSQWTRGGGRGKKRTTPVPAKDCKQRRGMCNSSSLWDVFVQQKFGGEGDGTWKEKKGGRAKKRLQFLVTKKRLRPAVQRGGCVRSWSQNMPRRTKKRPFARKKKRCARGKRIRRRQLKGRDFKGTNPAVSGKSGSSLTPSPTFRRAGGTNLFT